MRKIKLAILAGVMALAGASAALPVSAAKVICEEGEKAGQYIDEGECTTQRAEGSTAGTEIVDNANTLIQVILGVLGIVAVIVVILGGFQYIMSNGDAGKIKQAKDTIMYGLIGLVVAVLAFVIVNFVLSSL